MRDNGRINDRRRSELPRAYEPLKLNARHHEILRLNLMGYSNMEVAERLSCTPATVSNALNSGLGRAQTSLLSAEADYNALEVAKSLRELAPKAVAAIKEILEDETTKGALKLKAAQDVLDRVGHGAVKQVKVDHTQLSLTADDLANIRERAYEAARSSGLIVDSETVNVEQ